MKIFHCDSKLTIGGGDRNNMKPCFIKYEQYNYLLCVFGLHNLLFRNFKPAMMSGIVNVFSIYQVKSYRIQQRPRFCWLITVQRSTNRKAKAIFYCRLHTQ